MRRSFLLAAAALLLAPAVGQAQAPLNVYQTIAIAAPAGKVWHTVKNWDNLHGWHPAFASTQLLSGQNDTVGAVRRLTLKDGPSFAESRQRRRLRRSFATRSSGAPAYYRLRLDHPGAGNRPEQLAGGLAQQLRAQAGSQGRCRHGVGDAALPGRLAEPQADDRESERYH
jgi:hypothetical protein